MSDFSEEAKRWMLDYHGSVDVTALLMAFDAGRDSVSDQKGGHSTGKLVASDAGGLAVSSRDALAQALFETSHNLLLGLRDPEVNPLTDALLASGVVRVLPDEETVAQAIQDAQDWYKAGALEEFARMADARGHEWSGAAAHDFFHLAVEARARAAEYRKATQ